MKQTMLLALMGISICCKAQVLKTNFSINKIPYEFSFTPIDKEHITFTICKSGGKFCNQSDPLLNELNEEIFNSQFDKILTALNPSVDTFKNEAADNKTSYEKERQLLYTKSKKTLDSSIIAKNTQQKIIDDKIHEATDEENKTIKIGKLLLLDKDITVYDSTGKPPRTSKVNNVQINIEDGVISRRGLIVTLIDSTRFYNRSAPISFARFNDRKKWHIVRTDRRDDSAKLYIFLGDVLDYLPIGKLYYPDSDDISLSQDKRVDSLKTGVNLNSYLDFSIYTDVLGLLGRKPNGLLQSEIMGNIISNTGSAGQSSIVFHSFVRPYIRWSRFDSKFASIDSSTIKPQANGKDKINRTYLNQISYFQGGLKMNVVKSNIGINQSVNINIGAEINLVATDSLKSIAGSKYNDDIMLLTYYPELTYTIKKFTNFCMDCSLKFLYQRIADRSTIIDNKSFEWMFNPQINIYYYPFDKSSNRVYFRFAYFDNFSESFYNYTQFQFGYKTSLNAKNTKK